jgi:hypothetical protein
MVNGSKDAARTAEHLLNIWVPNNRQARIKGKADDV